MKEVQERRPEMRVEDSAVPQVWGPEEEDGVLFLWLSPGLPLAIVITEELLNASEEQLKTCEYCYLDSNTWKSSI